MDRRAFIVNTASAAILSMNVKFAFAQSKHKIPHQLEKTIKAEFGSGFQVLSHQIEKNNSYAVIEHLENRYLITSTDSDAWTIVSSNIS